MRAGTGSISEAESENLPAGALKRRLLPLIVVGIFSVFYFAETIIRASEKPFWFDELCTLYIVRLPTFAASWTAVLHGVDYNPPLYYVIQRAARALFGEGRVALRLPAILGFWTLCVCLFHYANKRAGVLAGWVAMALPMVTGAYYYAYEARPHGIVLGFCGLALIAWQASEEERRRRKTWLLAFALFLGAAFFTHCYALVIAIPFGLAELASTVMNRRFRPSRWLAMAVPGIVAVVSFIPLLRTYRATVGGTGFGFNDRFSAGWFQIPDFYHYVLSRCFLIVLGAFVLFALERAGAFSRSLNGVDSVGISVPEAVLLSGFWGIPLYGLLLAQYSKGPFFARYFMTAVIGVALTLAVAARMSGKQRRGSAAVALVIGSVLVWNSLHVFSHRYHQRWEPLVEPSTGWTITTTSPDPLAVFDVLRDNLDDSLPIVVSTQLDFLYLLQYWPSLQPRLYTVSDSEHDLQYRLYQALRTYGRAKYNRAETYSEFLPEHRDFLFFGESIALPLLASLKSKGAQIETLHFGYGDSFVAKVHMGPQ